MTLEQIRARADAATPGPWYVEQMGNHHEDVLALSEDGSYVIAEHAGDDAEFIAHAREDVPRLLDALQAVLDMHVSEDSHWHQCVGCGEDCQYCENDHPWPCPTVIAITNVMEATT